MKLPDNWLADDTPPPTTPDAPPVPAPVPKGGPQPDADRVMFLGDWYVDVGPYYACPKGGDHRLKPVAEGLRRCWRCWAFKGPDTWFAKESLFKKNGSCAMTIAAAIGLTFFIALIATAFGG